MATPNFTAGDVMTAAAALLNDQAMQTFTYAVQIPYLKMALGELREYMQLANVPVTNRVDSILQIPAGTTEISFITTPALPTDLIEVQQCWERVSEGYPWTPMIRKEFLPHWLDGQVYYSFLVWAWYNNAIHLPPSVQINELKLDYIAQTDQVTDENSQLELINGQSFLNYRTAALVAEYAGENKTRADDLNLNAQNALDRLMGIESKARQPIAIRRRPFRMGYKSRNWW